MKRSIGAALLTAGILSLSACGGGGGGGSGSVVVTPPDTTPNAFAFTDQNNVALSAPVTSAPVTLTGIDAASAISVGGGAYSIGCNASYVTTAATVNPGQQVCVRHTSALTGSTTTDTTLTVGGVSDTFSSTTSATDSSDTTPDVFTFTDQTNVAQSTSVTSAAVTITGIDAPSMIAVSGGAYSIGCTAAYATTAATISQGQQVCVRHTSAANSGTATNTLLTVGGVSDTFTSTTAVAQADATPDQFLFADQTNVAQSTQVTSTAVTITGTNVASPISVAGGEYSVGCNASYVATSGIVNPGQQVCVRHISAANSDTATDTTLTVGGVSDTFTSTTGSADTSIALQRAFPALSFADPVALQQVPGDASRWFVVEQAGVIRVFANSDSVASSAVFVNITGLVGDGTGERGLFDIAFDPAFASNRHVYLSYTRSSPTLTSYVSRFTSTDGGLTLNPASEVVVLTLPQPYENHNGGHLTFGPDGFLYVGFGDGGAGNDPENRAQDTTNLWGAIIRINVGSLPYTIPADNPFAGNARCNAGAGAAACPEIFAWGLRNPWKFNFDSLTGELYAGDVGQGAWEEVDLIENGGNYGWRIREGAHCNIPAVGCSTAGLTDPIAEYSHSVGRSITGGYVYRGSAINGLAGSYVFGDFGSGRIFRLANGAPPLETLLETRILISSFAQDTAGELFVVSYGDGAIHRIVPAGP